MTQIEAQSSGISLDDALTQAEMEDGAGDGEEKEEEEEMP